MRKLLGFGVGLWLMCAAGGCGSGAATPEHTVRQKVEALNEMATLLTSIKDESSADAALAQIAKNMGRVRALDKQLDSFDLSQGDKQGLLGKYQTELDQAAKKMEDAVTQAKNKVPGRARDIENLVAQVRAKK
jgi:hypothetical protein